MAVDPRLVCLPEHEGPAFHTWQLIMQTTMGKAMQPASPSFQFAEKFTFKPGEDFIPLNSTPFANNNNGPTQKMRRKKSHPHSSPGSSSSEDEDDKPPIAPWMKRRYPENAYGLHIEMMDFYQFMSPLPEEEAMRKEVVLRMTNLITSIWPAAQVEVFGSFKTKSYLPCSDIDLVVFGKWDKLPLFTLEKALTSRGIADPATVKVLDKATVPIIKLTDKESRVRVDISFNTDTALKGAYLIKKYMEEYKVLPYLFRVLKQFLAQRDLNEVFSGGISSYCLMLLIVSFLQRHPRTDVKRESKVNLGVLLMEFFELYGRNFNYQKIGIKLRNGGRYQSKDEIMKEMDNGEYPPLLCIEDPITRSVDIGKSSYGIMRVKEAFEHGFNVLDSALRNRHYFKINPNSTYLSRIINISQDVLYYRQWVQQKYFAVTHPRNHGIIVTEQIPTTLFQQSQTNFRKSRPPLLPTPPSPYTM